MRTTARAMCTVALVFLIGCECYQVNPLPPDAAPDAFAADAYLPPPDVAFSQCENEHGAFECNTEECPRAICTTCFPAQSGPGLAFCMDGLGGTEGAHVCSLAGPCVDGRLCATGAGSLPPSGVCAVPEVCATLRDFENTRRCHYLDGTPFITGDIPPTPCPGAARGIACGPGCGECDVGFECFGTSEHSGVGHCGLAEQSPPRPACGTVGDTTLTCEGARRCLRFVAPSDVEPFGSCLDATTCARLEELMPERFRCE